MDRRIAPPRDFEGVLDDLTSPRYNVFDSKQKALMFAAAVGWYLKARTPIDKRGITIRVEIFQNRLDDGFISALAIAETGSLQVLSPEREDERATIFEEYAHTGLREIKRRCFDEYGDPLQNLIQLTDEVRSPLEETIAGVDPDLLRDLIG